jgi:hypothetical protein
MAMLRAIQPYCEAPSVINECMMVWVSAVGYLTALFTELKRM